jgi:hypothetical protein
MVQNPSLRINKTRKPVVLWVYPEGRVVGSLFVSPQSKHAMQEEEPLQILNHPAPFVVVYCHTPDEIRFYNKAAIIRVEYEDAGCEAGNALRSQLCQLHLMDGSLLVADMRQSRPPHRSRLYDDLSGEDDRFVKLYSTDGTVCLVNKSYVVTGIGMHEHG